MHHEAALDLGRTPSPQRVEPLPAPRQLQQCIDAVLDWSRRKGFSNAKGPQNAARIRRTPVLQVENQADDAVPASHNPTIRAALATPDQEYIRIEGATHYYQNQPRQLQQCIDAVLDWSRRKGLLAE